MDPFFSHQELELTLKSIGMRIDWLRIETERYAAMIDNPLLVHFREINSLFLQKLENELDCLLQLQKRILTDPPSTTHPSTMVEA